MSRIRLAFPFMLTLLPMQLQAVAYDSSAPAPVSVASVAASVAPSAPLPFIPLLRYSGFPSDSISLHLDGASLVDVFTMFSKRSGVNLLYGADVEGTVTLALDHVPLDAAFQILLDMGGWSALPVAPRVVRIVSAQVMIEQGKHPVFVSKAIRLKYARAELIKPQLDILRSAAGRPGSISVDLQSNSLVLKDTALGMMEAEQILAELDRQPVQVAIEARIVEVQNLRSTDLGIQWGVAATENVGSQRINIGASDIPSPGGAGTLSGQRVALNGGQTVVLPVPGLGVGLNSLGDAVGVLSIGVIGNSAQFNVALNALAKKNKLRVLSSPQILTLNNQQASILVGSQIPYAVTTISPGVGQTQSYQFVDVGVKLSVTPTVNDGGRITLKVVPEVSKATIVTIGAPPSIDTRKAETTVIIHNGETMVIGGLMTEDQQRLASGVPFLGSVPILGHLFKSTSHSNRRTELVVFLTPKIVKEQGTRYDVPAQTPIPPTELSR